MNIKMDKVSIPVKWGIPFEVENFIVKVETGLGCFNPREMGHTLRSVDTGKAKAMEVISFNPREMGHTLRSRCKVWSL